MAFDRLLLLEGMNAPLSSLFCSPFFLASAVPFQYKKVAANPLVHW